VFFSCFFICEEALAILFCFGKEAVKPFDAKLFCYGKVDRKPVDGFFICLKLEESNLVAPLEVLCFLLGFGVVSKVL